MEYEEYFDVVLWGLGGIERVVGGYEGSSSCCQHRGQTCPFLSSEPTVIFLVAGNREKEN